MFSRSSRRLGALSIATGAGIALALVAWARPSEAATNYKVTGSAAGLYPGASVPMVITITSSETKPITVQTLNALITSPVAGCKASYFTLAPYKTKLVVKAKSSGIVTLPITMAKTAPQACAAQTLKLTFVSTATY